MKLQPKLLTLALLVTLGLSACEQPAAEATAASEPAAAVAVPAATAPADPVSPAGPAKYKVEFTPAWTKANFPFEYPDTSLLHKPHFSGWIGTAHNDNYTVFREATMPTPGLEALSEKGKHAPLDEEIKAAIAAGNALELSESEPLKDFSMTSSFEITVDDTHPMAAVVAMIAPSPDWFAGVDVNLMENGAWVAAKTVDVMAWDSGGDDGTTYLADDVDTDPKKPTMVSTDKHFMDGTMPVGSLTFTKM